MQRKTVRDYIRTIPDFPHAGILFRDVTTLFADARGMRLCVDQLLAPFAGEQIDAVAGLEARGFILGGAIAHQLGTGFVPIRKKGKLPGETFAQDYALEYGRRRSRCTATPCPPARGCCWSTTCCATGGTARAGIALLERLGCEIVGCAFVVDLPELGGRAALDAMGLAVHTLCAFEGS